MALEIKENEILANHSTFRIGGPARYFAVAGSRDELREAKNFAEEKGLSFFVFGGGSNVLFSDEGYNGVVIQIKDMKLKADGLNMLAGAGVLFGQLIIRSIDSGLAGLEWGVGIPGTVGGAVVGNAGAYGHSISEFVKSVEVLTESGEVKKYSKEDCGFVYRGSKFKAKSNSENLIARPVKSGFRNPDNGDIILEVEFSLEKGDKRKSGEMISDILKKRRGKLPPHPSAGSVFKNIVIDDLENKDGFLNLIPPEKIKGGKFATGFLIEECGLKGKQIGGAKIAEEHANFIINVGDAKAGDVLELIEVCKREVGEKFGINLKEEIIVLQ